MPNKSWAYVPFLWDIASLPRHPSWTYPTDDLPVEWNEWAQQYRAFYEDRGRNEVSTEIMSTLNTSSDLTNIPHHIQMKLLHPLMGPGQAGHALDKYIRSIANHLWFPITHPISNTPNHKASEPIRPPLYRPPTIASKVTPPPRTNHTSPHEIEQAKKKTQTHNMQWTPSSPLLRARYDEGKRIIANIRTHLNPRQVTSFQRIIDVQSEIETRHSLLPRIDPILYDAFAKITLKK